MAQTPVETFIESAADKKMSVSPNAKGRSVAISSLGPELRQEWSDFVQHCEEGWLNHLPEFVLNARKSGRWKDNSFYIRIDQKLIAVCVIGVERDGAGLILVGPGPAVLAEYRSKSVLALLEAEILERAKRHKCCAIRLVIHPCAPAMWRRRFVDSYLTRFKCSFGIRGITPDYEGGYHAVSDLSRSDDEIFRDLSNGHKGNIKRCNRANLRVEQHTGPGLNADAWDDFLNVYQSTATRRGFRAVREAELGFIREKVEAGYFTLFNSYQDQRICATILLETYKNAAYYKAAGADQKGLALGAMVHLHFEAMKALRQRGFKYYCLGPIIPMIRGTVSGDIADFKARLGNERWDMLRGERILRRRSYYLRVLAPKLALSTMPGIRSSFVAVRKVMVRLQARVRARAEQRDASASTRAVNG